MLAAALVASLTGSIWAAQNAARSPSRTDYEITAELDGDTKILTGAETVSWTNGSGETVSDLWFHLYLNAFSNNRSTHLVEAKGKLRDTEMEEGWGWSRVTSIKLVDPDTKALKDLMPSFKYRYPDDGNEDDRTVFSVDLPSGVPPGATVDVRVEWEAQLPRVRRRTGYKDDFLLVAQWFPKLGVYEEGRGWNCHQFHMNSEFYSNYGNYDVELDLPAKYEGKVFGSGVQENQRVSGDRVIVRFLAPSTRDRYDADATGKVPAVHDFTWTGDPRYRIERFMFDPAEWEEQYPEEVAFARAALGEDRIRMRKVDVTVLIQPERADQARRHFRATSAALFFYGLWFGEYPYEHVTVIDPRWGARAAGGMEYPTLFTCGSRCFTTPDMYVPESVTVHECGHQFWYGLVGNNEFEAAWLDEGFNSYADSEVLWRVYGPRRATTDFARLPVDGVAVGSTFAEGKTGEILSLRRIPLPFGIPLKPVRPSGFLDRWRAQPRLTFVKQWSDPRWRDRSGYLSDPDSDPIDTFAWEHVDRSSYRTNSYPRTAAALRTLQEVVGDEEFLRGMRHYSETWRYDHPYPDDFFRTFQEGAGVDCQWYFEDVFRSTKTGDWSVEVSQRVRPRKRGFIQGQGGVFMEHRPEEEEDERDEDEGPWLAEVVLRRDGGLRLPLPVRLTFADGTTDDQVWTRAEQEQETWKKLVFETETKLVAVELDPEGRNFLDGDVSNNRWYHEVDSTARWRWGERVLSQAQHYLHWIGGIGG